MDLKFKYDEKWKQKGKGKTYTLWLLELINLSSSVVASLMESWMLDLEFILFHSFSTRKKTHWKRRSISKAAIVKTVR